MLPLLLQMRLSTQRNMITVIASTNRKDSGAKQFATHYHGLLRQLTDEPVALLALEDIPHDWFHPHMYEPEGQAKSLRRLQERYILPADKFVFVVPEYNGGFPGVLKLFLDAVSVYRYRDNFFGKKAALVGIASGRAGNLRGMEHLTGILNHLGIVVFPDRLPISSIENLIDAQGRITDPATLQVLEQQARAFLAF